MTRLSTLFPRTTAAACTGLLLGTFALPAAAQRQGSGGADPTADLSTSDQISEVTARSIGPAAMSGRVVDIAVAYDPSAPTAAYGNIFYIAAASGGVWKTTNGGLTFDPVFDDTGIASIGDIAVAPSNGNIVYVGTGEANLQRSSSYGNGIYRSLDGGGSWEHMGLETSQHVGRILVHPKDPMTVYVAAVGPLWAAGGERGVFRSRDGGETWSPLLTVDQHTGATDLVFDPKDPDVIYAATYQRERRAYGYIGGGPGSGIWKSSDAGDTWAELTRGLPEGDLGRIGLDISLSQPNTLYAVVEGDGAGVYRTDDGGINWRLTDDIQSIPWYFGQIRVDPSDPEVVYHLGVPLVRSWDGGQSWSSAADNGVHVDHHALWINPKNNHHLILGNDGGLYVSHDRGESWDWAVNLPISQYYAIGYDMQEPFYGVYGGFQDNNTWGGPSRTRSRIGIPNSAWFVMAGGDGFYAAIDPTDHTIAYVESQNGNISRYDARTGDRKGIRPIPEPGELPYRFNWSAPIQISPFDPSTVYFAANHLFKSTDLGDTWERLGEDLTRAIDRETLPMMGSVPEKTAVAYHQGVAVFSNISTISVSEMERGLLATGSDDGTIAVSQDDGRTWTRSTSFPGVPDTTYVSKVRWSKHDANTLYATFDGHRSNDFLPYVLKSTDRGASWSSIASDLPTFGNVRAFAEHPDNPDVLFVGTEFYPFVSVDGGASWHRVGGVPPAPVHDLKVHPRDNALIVGTHGRGIYILDDLNPFLHLAEAQASGEAFLMPVAPTLAFTEDRSQYTGTHADRNYSGDNPPVGTHVWYYLPEGGQEVTLDILAADGRRVRTLEASGSAGLQSAHWDLRFEQPWDGPEEEGGGPGFFSFFGGGNQGPLVIPGEYTARLTLAVDDGADVVLERPITVTRDDAMRLTNAQLAQLQDYRLDYQGLNAQLEMALKAIDDMRDTLDDLDEALAEARADDSLVDQAEALRDAVDQVDDALRSPRGRGGSNPYDPTDDTPPVQSRMRVAGGMMNATAMPTTQELDALSSIPGDLANAVGALNGLLSEDFHALVRALDEAGVPWTPGRVLGPVGSR
jgi:photosystem II stability/assembly factor-like uncharacterized protein